MHTCDCPRCGSALIFPDGRDAGFCQFCGARIAFPAAAPEPVAPGGGAGSVSRAQLAAAALSYVAAYFYLLMAESAETVVWQTLVVAACLIGATLLLNRDTRAPSESWLWFGCLTLSLVSFVWDIGHVWYRSEVLLFVHCFAVWWVMSRSGVLTDTDRGDLFPLNALNGFVMIPFGSFFLRLRTVAGGLRNCLTGRAKVRMNWWILPASALCVLLFLHAAVLLGRADAAFSDLLTRLADRFRFGTWDGFGEFLTRFLFSLPVGCYLFGLTAGAQRTDRSRLEARRGRALAFLDALKKLPARFWEFAILFFSVLYLAFFLLQGSYLFGAFTGRLPEGFIVSEYARQGFFELCRVMAVNALLLWLSTRMSRGAPDRRLKLFCLFLLLESILFSSIAFSKLALYISIYGFTPLRLQSSWLVCVLFAGCVLWIWNLFTGRRVFRYWMYFGAVTLTLLVLF